MLGVALSLGALFGVARRLCFALSTLLYLSYVAVTRDFLSFQWDNLLIECGFLAAFLRTDAAAPVAHFLFRLVLFKLYFESGIAKWRIAAARLAGRQRDDLLLRDRAAADVARLVCAPPARLVAPPREPGDAGARAGRAVRHLRPAPGCACSPFAAFTLFQIVNAATANYGFFCYLAVVLGVFLLDDADVVAARARLARAARSCRRRHAVSPRASPAPPQAAAAALPALLQPRARRWVAIAGAASFALVSLADASSTSARRSRRCRS